MSLKYKSQAPSKIIQLRSEYFRLIGFHFTVNLCLQWLLFFNYKNKGNAIEKLPWKLNYFRHHHHVVSVGKTTAGRFLYLNLHGDQNYVYISRSGNDLNEYFILKHLNDVNLIVEYLQSRVPHAILL